MMLLIEAPNEVNVKLKRHVNEGLGTVGLGMVVE
jgi:hypothetical protein